MKPSRFIHNRGFTLVEVLAVVVIVAIMLGLAVINVNPNTRDDRLRREAGQLFELMRLGAEEAVLQTREFGIRFSPEGYLFYELNGDKWKPLEQDQRLRERELPEDLEPVIEIDGLRIVLEETGGDSPKPHIMMLSSGEVIPDFTILLRDADTEHAVRIIPGEATNFELQFLDES